MKPIHFLTLAGLALCTVIFVINPVAGLVFLTLFACATNLPRARCCTVTLSVPEILMDVLDAFKIEIPEMFGEAGFATDFSSKTAVLGDKITARISHVPTVGTYDPNNDGWENAVQDVTTLFEDVPVTLNQLPIVTIKVGWLTQISSKIPLYKEAVRNYGYALARSVVLTVLEQAVSCFSNTLLLPPPFIDLNSVESIRDQLNHQKAAGTGRFGLVTSAFAQSIGADDRVRSALYYAQLNGDRGYRRWTNLAGFSWVKEYAEATGTIAPFIGLFADHRAITVAARRLDYANAADELGVPKIMEFYPIEDPESGLNLTAVSYQKPGTGDVIVGCGMLFGVSCGNQGGAAGTITDNAGLLIRQS